jgi:hypothetical protein
VRSCRSGDEHNKGEKRRNHTSEESFHGPAMWPNENAQRCAAKGSGL